MPCFGPCWVNLYGSTRDYSYFHENSELNDGVVSPFHPYLFTSVTVEYARFLVFSNCGLFKGQILPAMIGQSVYIIGMELFRRFSDHHKLLAIYRGFYLQTFERMEIHKQLALQIDSLSFCFLYCCLIPIAGLVTHHGRSSLYNCCSHVCFLNP